MSDFVSNFWNWYIMVGTAGGILLCLWLIRWMNKDRPAEKDVEATGHVWDGDLQELNNPLPMWWLNMFYITIFFGIGYLILYPGFGTFKGILDWSQTTSYEAEVKAADEKYGPLFERYADQSLKALGSQPKAMKMGQRLFVTYCTQCHGSDAGGVPGFPNLRDADWLWGGSPEAIEQTILSGRTGTMPAWEGPLGGEEGVKDMTNYVMSLSDRKVNNESAERGKEKFATFCVACHGTDAKGNPLLGAPNLTDNIWLYGGSPRRITQSIAKGRTGRMPAHKDFLGQGKVHLLAAYIYNLSGD